MRSVCLGFLILCTLDPAASAGELKSPVEIVEELAAYVAREDADFEGAIDLYKAAKQALADEAKAGEATPAADRYAEIRPRVAEVMRRNALPASAVLMGFFGATLLWGGFFFCIGVARKKGGSGGRGGG